MEGGGDDVPPRPASSSAVRNDPTLRKCTLEPPPPPPATALRTDFNTRARTIFSVYNYIAVCCEVSIKLSNRARSSTHRSLNGNSVSIYLRARVVLGELLRLMVRKL